MGRTNTQFSYEELHESDLIRRAISGDRQAGSALFARHYDPMYRVALRCTRNPDLAWDVVQDSCLKALGKLSQFRGEAQFSSWVSAIVINTARASLRDANRFISYSDSFVPEQECVQPNPEKTFSGRQMLGRVMRQLRSHREEDFQLIFRRCLVGQSVGHISRETGLSIPSVKVRVHRARIRLRSCLDLG